MRMALRLACLPLLAIFSFAQQAPTLSLRADEVQYCDDGGLRTIRVRSSIHVRNEGSLPAVIPGLVSPLSVTITEAGLNDVPQNVPFIRWPATPPRALENLKGAGGTVLLVPGGERRDIVGLELLFWADEKEARRRIGKSLPPDARAALEVGKEYALRATIPLFSSKLVQLWSSRGYLVRPDAVAVGELSIPSQPAWRPCLRERLVIPAGK